MSNVLEHDKQQQVLALGRVGWSLRRIEDATGVRRETASHYLKAAAIAVRERGGRPRVWPPANPATTSEVSTDSPPANPATTPEVSTDVPLPAPGERSRTHLRLAGPAVAEASRFLKVMGVNDFSLFCDLDGLSRFLRKRIKGGWGIVA